jgi:inosine-uridine nucleoside N-ribohydrolase
VASSFSLSDIVSVSRSRDDDRNPKPSSGWASISVSSPAHLPTSNEVELFAIMELADIDVPLAMGCAGPLAQRSDGVAPVHGNGGLDRVELPEPKRQPAGVHAVDFIIDMVSRHRSELVFATIGPETNVALALTREPRLSAGCARSL